MSPFLIRLARRYLFRHPWQTILMILGITLGVAVAVAVDLANASASRAFTMSTESVAGKATHFIAGGPLGLDETVYTTLRRSGITAASAPVITAYVASPQLGGGLLQLLGVDPFAEAPFRSYLTVSQNTAGPDLTSFLTRPGAILISDQLGKRYNLRVGDALTLESGGRSMTAFVAGLIDPDNNLSRQAMDTLLLADISTAQELTNQIGRLERIDLILPAKQSAQIEAQINALLPADTRVQPVSSRTETIEQMTGAFQLNLSALSLLALVVGLFLIYNTMTFSVVQRRALFGTLRCLGVTRLEIFSLVVGEALLVGIIGSLFGIGLGVLLGQGAVRLVTQTINDLFFVLTVQGVQIPFSSLLKGLVLGIFATAFSALPPAWEAASIAPRLALSRSGLESKARQAVFLAARMGILSVAIGGFILMIPTKNLVVSFTGTFAVVIGAALLAPISTLGLARAAMPILSVIWGALGRMAPRNVAASLSRTSVAVAALMVAVSVTIGVSLMVGSFRHTVVIWLAEVLQGDIYISAPSLLATQTSAPINPQVISRVQKWPGVDKTYQLRAASVDSPIGPVQIAASDNDQLVKERLFVRKDFTDQELQAKYLAGGILVSEPFANRFELPNEYAVVELYTDLGLQRFEVLGVYYDYGSTQGTVMMALDVYRRFWHDDSITAVSLRLAPGVDPTALSAVLRDKLADDQLLSVRPNQTLRAEVMQVFDRTFAITGALQLLATLVAFIGVLSALLSLELERQRELGILRAIGLTVRQLWGLVNLETGLLGLVAGLLSMPTGYILALILIYIINQRSFGWTLQMLITPLPFVQALFLALAAALLAGIYPAYRMGKMITAEAMRFE